MLGVGLKKLCHGFTGGVADHVLWACRSGVLDVLQSYAGCMATRVDSSVHGKVSL